MYWVRDGENRLVLGPRLLSSDLLTKAPEIVDELSNLAHTGPDASAALVGSCRSRSDLTYVLTAVATPERSCENLALVFALNGRPVDSFLAITQLLAGYVNLWDAWCSGRDLSWEASQSAAIIELVAQLQDIEDSRQAKFGLVNGICERLGSARVALGVVDGAGTACRVEAISELSEFDRRSSLADAVEAALAETVVREEVVEWPNQRDDGLSGLSAHRRLQTTAEATVILSVPLATSSDHTVGALTCWWNGPVPDVEKKKRLLSALMLPVGAVLNSIEHGTGAGALTQTVRRYKRTWNKSRWLTAMLLCVVVAASLFIPVKHRLSAKVLIEPLTHRIVAAPFDGIVQKSTVKPGDIVVRGDTLVQLDGREINWQLNGLRAEVKATEKRRDISMADGNTSAAQLARLDMQRLQARMQLLEHHLDNLEVKSPLNGMIITGNLDRNEGSPVKKGQSLFEVAPLDRVIAEVGVAASDISYFKPDMPLTITLDSLPDAIWTLRLPRVRPRATIRDGSSVFIGEVEITNEASRLRPGMGGDATLYGDDRALGWVLFHKPWERVLRWLGVSGQWRNPD